MSSGLIGCQCLWKVQSGQMSLERQEVGLTGYFLSQGVVAADELKNLILFICKQKKQ